MISKLKDYFDNVKTKLGEIEKSINTLDLDTKTLQNGLDDANNRISLLKNVKYVKEVSVLSFSIILFCI